MRELENVRDTILRLFNDDEWVKWVHEGLLPAYTNSEKKRNIELAKMSNHCAICRNVNGCCFPKNNNINYPMHSHCHCFLIDIAKPQITADCSIDKFERYVFAEEYLKNGKFKLFKDWGYDIMNSEYLIKELTRQAREKYASGDFVLDKLDEFGQRITIIAQLERKNGNRIVKFKTGWLVYPDGNIKNTTPFSGEVE